MSLTNITVTTTFISVNISWTASSPGKTFLPIAHTFNETTYTTVVTKNERTTELTGLSPDTSIQITVQLLTLCGPVGAAITKVATTDPVREYFSLSS